MNPKNDGLLVARGILQYGSSPRAITDFDQAVKLGSPVVWPYLFLAHYYLTSNRLEQCREMCEAGLRMRGSDTAKSQLEEWRAIAQAELGFPRESVRAAFEAAVRLDPLNELARRNQDAFEASLRVPRATSSHELGEEVGGSHQAIRRRRTSIILGGMIAFVHRQVRSNFSIGRLIAVIQPPRKSCLQVPISIDKKAQ